MVLHEEEVAASTPASICPRSGPRCGAEDSLESAWSQFSFFLWKEFVWKARRTGAGLSHLFCPPPSAWLSVSLRLDGAAMG